MVTPTDSSKRSSVEHGVYDHRVGDDKESEVQDPLEGKQQETVGIFSFTARSYQMRDGRLEAESVLMQISKQTQLPVCSQM